MNQAEDDEARASESAQAEAHDREQYQLHDKRHACHRCGLLFSNHDWETGTIKMYVLDGRPGRFWVCEDCVTCVIQWWLKEAK